MPAFVTEPVPAITPEKVVDALLVMVKFEAPNDAVPSPERLEIVATLVPDVSKVAPLEIATLPLVLIVPLPPKANIPAEIVVDPVYVLTPERESVPVPTFVTDPLPAITPENVVDALLVIVKADAPNDAVPSPDRFEIVATLVLDVFNVAPLAIATLPLLLIVPLPPKAKIPAEIVVEPV